MRRLAVCSLLVGMFFLSGCPVILKNSIDDGTCDVPSWLPGRWHEVTTLGKKGDEYFLEKDLKKGHLKYYEIDSVGKVNYHTGKDMVLSVIGNKTFLSAYHQGDAFMEEGYYYFELRKVSNSELVIAGIKEHSLDYEATRLEILKFLNDNKDKEAIFDPNEITQFLKD